MKCGITPPTPPYQGGYKNMKFPKIPKPNFAKIPKPKFPDILGNKDRKPKNAGIPGKILRRLKKKLEKGKKELEKELKRIATRDKKVAGDYDAKFPAFGTKPDENAMEVTEYQDRLALSSALEVDLLKMNNALAKIKAGTYGVCEKCVRPINPKRLEALPGAAICLECGKK
ncbi:hypothetical protein COT68_01070 [bacterium (Candidatus Torokbacteria) CG09_land_8_20_14_0_10_42_11]|nr:MAG: hypothetical protein COT68_01070 [bacterium (Candidatus Torokbacteria) CG09_land_8_20_14_0_10_42_11]